LSLAPHRSATTPAFKHQAATILSGVALDLTWGALVSSERLTSSSAIPFG